MNTPTFCIVNYYNRSTFKEDFLRLIYLDDIMENYLETASPVYSITSMDSYPLNPYRMFVHYICTNAINAIGEHIPMSLLQFSELSYDERKTILLNKIKELNLSDLIIKFNEKPAHEKIFFEFNMKKENVDIGTFLFYKHLSYVSSTKSDTREYAAAELDFTIYDCFNFLQGLPSTSNILDFARDDMNEYSFDMIIATIYALYNFTDFVKYLKTKMLVVKNIQMFAEKLIFPIVTDMQLTFAPEKFMIGVLCGDKILKDTYVYDNYLKTIKEFEQCIRNKFGETYAHKDDKDKKS